MTNKEQSILDFYNKIDFDLLVNQKQNLLEMFKKTMSRGEREALDGVIHLMDALGDIELDNHQQINKYVLVATTNGEGYSDVIVEVIEGIDATISRINHFRNEATEYAQETKYDELDYGFDFMPDSSRIQAFKIPSDRFTLLEIKPDINEVAIYSTYSEKKDAKATMQYLMEIYRFAEDDVNDYDEEDSFGSHEENKGYIHLEII